MTVRSIGAYYEISVDYNTDDLTPPASKKPRGKINVCTPKVVAALDTCQISDRHAVHLIAAVAEALEFDLASLILNRTSIRLHREQVREVQALNIKEVFQTSELKGLVLHWDGKLLPDIFQHEVVDRVPVIVSNGGTDKLLGVPKLQDGKGVYTTRCYVRSFETLGPITADKRLML